MLEAKAKAEAKAEAKADTFASSFRCPMKAEGFSKSNFRYSI
jgi:hypothetical protein